MQRLNLKKHILRHWYSLLVFLYEKDPLIGKYKFSVKFVFYLSFAWFFTYPCLGFSLSNCLQKDCLNNDQQEMFLKNISYVPSLAKKCKTIKGLAQNSCSDKELSLLKNYILYFCGAIPETVHQMNDNYFHEYISSPMLNTAFLRVWSNLNINEINWAKCVVCFLHYPNHDYWEKNLRICANNH